MILPWVGCKSSTNKSSPQKILEDSETFIDSVRTARQVDSMVKETINSVYRNVADSSGSWRSPVQVMKAVMVKNEYTSTRSVRLSYKNVSEKKVAAIKFRWYGVDAFGEPADMGDSFEGLGSGLDNDGLNVGAKKTGTWNVYSSRGRKVTSACAIEVAFDDGSVWKLKNDHQ